MKKLTLYSTIIICLVFLVFFNGCVHTVMEHYTHPEAADITFQKILINCREDGLMRKKMAERIFTNFFNANTVKTGFVSYLSSFPPSRTPQKDILFAKLKEKGIDGYLIVTLRDERIRWNNAFEMIFHPVYMSDDPIVVLSYDLKLFDVHSKKLMWESMAEVRADTSATFPLVTKSMAKKALKGMVTSGIIAPGKKRY